MAIERRDRREKLESAPEVRVHDWDQVGTEIIRRAPFKLLDTTLRDGIQEPNTQQPSLEQKMQIIDLDAKVGIDAIDICMPGVGGKYYREGVQCAKYIGQKYPHIETVVLTRTIEDDVRATINFSKEADIPLSVILFRGSSDLRLLAEDWKEDEIVEDMYRYSKILVENGQKVISATEDTTRTRPEFLKKIFEAGIAGGASELCIADTVGYADPYGTANQFKWVRKEIAGAENMPLHFHGHDDTRNSVANSTSAIISGRKVVVHTTWLGAGERAGNTPTEAFLSDLERRGIGKYDISYVVPAAKLTSHALKIPIPVNHPLVGEIVFTNMSGIHAAGIYKAEQKSLKDVAGIVYSAVSPHKVNREHRFNIGTLSGRYNVIASIDRINGEYGLSIEYSDQLAKELLKTAEIKNSDLSDEEIIRVANRSGENGHLE